MLPDRLHEVSLTFISTKVSKLNNSEKKYLISLTSYVPFGPARLNLLMEYFGNAKKVWEVDRVKLYEVGLSQKLVEGFDKYRKNFDFGRYLKKLEKLKIKVIAKEEKGYPEPLKEIPSAPILIYVRGNLDISGPTIAIVGARKMTAYGKEVTENFTEELTRYGFIIVSGLARGVDTVAHKTTIISKGITIAVLGGGLDSIYPPDNTKLAEKIVEEGGALVSEYPLGYPALPINFATRNRIISGLSKGVLVIEGREKSGTLLTASAAAEQGRNVFAVPGQITSPMSEAPFFLIKNGARMVLSVKDILEELSVEFAVDRKLMDKLTPNTFSEERILSTLENEPLHLDEIARISTLAVSAVLSALTVMEMKGMVKSLGNGIYRKV